MNKFMVVLIAAGALLLGMGQAAAEQMKIGVVDIQQVFQKAPQVKEISENLSKKFKSRQDKIVAAQESLKNDIEKLERDGSILSLAEKNKLQDSIVTQKRDLQRMGQDFQQDFGREQNQAMQQFLAKVKTAINKIAKKNQYDLVLQKDAVPYAISRVNITKEVLENIS